MRLEWVDGGYLQPTRSVCGLYLIQRVVGGSMGPLYQAYFRAAYGVPLRAVGGLVPLMDDAKQQAQNDRDSLNT